MAATAEEKKNHLPHFNARQTAFFLWTQMVPRAVFAQRRTCVRLQRLYITQAHKTGKVGFNLLLMSCLLLSLFLPRNKLLSFQMLSCLRAVTWLKRILNFSPVKALFQTALRESRPIKNWQQAQCYPEKGKGRAQETKLLLKMSTIKINWK